MTLGLLSRQLWRDVHGDVVAPLRGLDCWSGTGTACVQTMKPLTCGCGWFSDMADDNVTCFPISYSKRQKSILGPLKVECLISGRLLAFDKEVSPLVMQLLVSGRP